MPKTYIGEIPGMCDLCGEYFAAKVRGMLGGYVWLCKTCCSKRNLQPIQGTIQDGILYQQRTIEKVVKNASN